MYSYLIYQEQCAYTSLPKVSYCQQNCHDIVKRIMHAWYDYQLTMHASAGLV